MCLLVDISLDELEHRTVRLAHLAAGVHGIPDDDAAPSCVNYCRNEPLDDDSFEVRLDIDVDDEDSNNNTNTNTNTIAAYKAKNLFGEMREKLERIGQKAETFKDELLLTLVGVTGQNAVQVTTVGNAALAATNGVAFVLLMSGLLLRSKSGLVPSSWVGNLLVLVGILVTLVGPVLDMTTKISGVGAYFVSFVAFLSIVGALTL